MEQKTIGKFISALRKANGMTQKDLAERLNVSDKTVSRWERDDGAPDLSMIPVLAEIFGVTCDELLRGERKPMEEPRTSPEELSSKGRKQQQRLLTMSLCHYRNRTFISMGLSLVGLIAAMICNFGFNRAYLGFLFGCIFYVASLVCQAIFINGAFAGVSDEEMAGEGTNRFKREVIRLACIAIGMTIVLLASTLPLIIFPFDTYMGITGDAWLRHGLLYGGLGIVISSILSYLLESHLLKIGLYPATEKATQTQLHNRKVLKNCAITCAIFFLATFLLQALANNVWTSWNQAEEIEFDTYEGFVHYMEQEVPYTSDNGTAMHEPLYSDENTTYYDAFGNEIPAEIALQETITVDGETGPKIVCTFLRKNQSVVDIRPADNDTGLPIAVVTEDALSAARWKNELINYGFFALYGIELAATIAYYMRKRKKS